MGTAEESWNRSLRNAYPCRFPVLNEPLTSTVEAEWISTRLQCKREAAALDDLPDVSSVLAAFAIVLNLFVGEDDVSFLSALDLSGDGEATAACLVSATVERRSKASDLTEACLRCLRPPDRPELTRLSQLNDTLKNRPSASAIPFNTFLLFGSSENDIHSVLSGTPPAIDLLLVVPSTASDSERELILWHRPHLLSGGAAGSVLNTYGQVLTEIERDVTRPIRDMALVSKQDIQLLTQWNSNVPTPSDRCVHQLFEEQVLANSTKTAVCSSDISLTYTELDAYAKRLSLKLKDFGVHVGDVVLLCFEKSVWAVVSQLAVLKCGGACSYLHLDFPPARSQKIAEMSRARIALSSPGTVSMLSHLSLEVVTVTQQLIEEPASTQIRRNEDVQVSSQSPAFVLFTSGSTGVPKGIIIDHSAVCTSFLAHGPIMMLKEDARVLQFAAYTWDASVAEIWTTLLFGGTVCVPSEEDRVDRLAHVIDTFQITQIWLTPTVACLLDPDDVPSLKRLFLIGEPATRDAIDRWAGRLDLRNAYGPTEACMFCSCTESLVSGCETRNVGYSFGGQVFTVDPENPASLLPPGAIGELVISGPIISKSYLDNAQETAAAFCARPEWPAETKISSSLERMYRTGDLGRMTAEGRIWHCGRRDNQVKLHGHRIQVDDIQHNLSRCLDFEFNIAVDVVEPDRDKTRPVLAAFVPIPGYPEMGSKGVFVLPPTPEISRKLQSIAHDLRVRGAEQLPAYMIPTLYLPVSHVPRSRSGKLDRGALKEYASQRSFADLMAYSTPSECEQQALTAKAEEFVAMFAEVLRLPINQIHMSQSFTELGGDSIDAIRLAGIGRRKSLVLSVAAILRARSLDELIRTEGCVNKPQGSSIVEALDLIGGDLGMREKLIADAARQCDVPVSCLQDIYPCTPLQEGMFILSQRRPGSYIAQYHFQLDFDEDLDRYKAAWQTAFDRFDVLRTRIIYKPDASGLLQAVTRENIQWADEGDLDDYLTRDKSRHMRAGDVLTRFAIIQNTDSKHMVFTSHHAMHDDWSLRLIFQSVSKLLRNLDMGPATPFRNFIKAISLFDNKQAMSHWARELQDLDAPTFPPLPRPGYAPCATQVLRIQIARPGRRTTYTEATIFRAALCLLIAKYTSSRDVLIGANVAGRSIQLEGIQALVGPTLATIPVRVLIDFQRSLGDFLSQIQGQSNNSLEFEYIGLEEIRQGTGIKYDFQTLLVVHLPEFQDRQDRFMQPAGLHLTTGSYGLMLEVSSHGARSTITATFDPQMIEHRQMQRLMNQFRHALERVRWTYLSAPLSSLDIYCPEDLVTLDLWNWPRPKTIHNCVHRAFEEQVERTPQASAISTHDREMTYEELNRLSSMLAKHLSENGVGPETVVPLCFGKSYLAVVAALAVLKAGGACTFLDPHSSQERLLRTCEQVEATIVICSESAKHKFMSVNNLRVIPLSQAWMESLPEVVQWSFPKVKPSNLAFVIFTSGESSVIFGLVESELIVNAGSTGEPKGIEQDHKAYCSIMTHYGAALGFAPGRRVFQFSANTWDVFLSDIMTSLAHGACVCIPSDEDRMSDLENSMCKLTVNQATLSPAVALLLQPRNVPRLEVLCIGGDLASSEVLRRWAHETRLINMYGPSEMAIWTTFRDQVGPSDDPRNIGKSSGSSIWLVEPENPDLVALLGTVGEIVISGPGLARGYLKDRAATEAAFVPAPERLRHLDESLTRIYRTGDLAHFNPDGELIFHGRRDDQVKLNGQRVELGGLQAELERSAHGFEISQIAAEVIRPHCRPGQQYLAAFVAAKMAPGQDMASVVSVMRERLARRLPSFVIPTLFIRVERLPLTKHGKLDRAELRSRGSALRPEQLTLHGYEPGEVRVREPNTSLERSLRDLWARILTIDPGSIGLDDSFWGLGGDSIGAMRLVMLARSCGLTLTVSDVLRASDLEEFAVFTSRCNDEIAWVHGPLVMGHGAGQIDR